jgi:hypothetical protein
VSSRVKLLSRAALAAVALSVLGTAAIGALHLPFARPLLTLVAQAAGCPVDLEGGDPEALERFRVNELRARAGTSAPRATPALGFELGVSSRTEVLAWLGASARDCKQMAQGSALGCENVVSDGEPAIASLYARFDADDKLVALDLFREGGSAEDALAHFARVDRSLGERVGPRTEVSGELDAAHLAAARYRRVASEFRYSSYVAALSAMNFGARGVRVRETYQYLPATHGS